MDVGRTAGPGGVDRAGDRPARVERQRASEPSHSLTDSASISDDGRETLAAVEALTERARRDDPARQDKVAEARERLEAGELETPEVFRAVARRMLGS